MKNKVSLFLMTFKGFIALKELLENGFHLTIDFVVIGRDSKIQNDYHKEIIKLCQKNNIKYYLRSDKYTLSSSYAIAISWRWIITLSNTKLIILHDSLLPKYRGFAPLVNCLINKEEYVGVTALFASENYDEGDIIIQERLKIQYPIKIKTAIELISNLYSEIVHKLFNLISSNEPIISQKQTEEEATYSLWRDEHDYFIDWSWDAKKIRRFVDAVGEPYDGAKSRIETEIVRIKQVEECRDLKIENRDNGKIILLRDEKPIVVCGTGLIKIIHADFLKNDKSIFPLEKFRLRFL
ncbi:MAG: formyltransferase family protein [Saprospiraceae bacterium]